tara:strand:+ start:58 stop:303 length:246 start_codon:yes stop_codon:yes gene_type:complete
MNKTYNNILDAFRSVFGSNVDLKTTFKDLNPFEEISTDTGPVLPEHVDQFLKDKKDIEHKKKEDQMVKNWKDEIEINKGGK